MRFKKQIIVICLFTLLFLPFSNIKKVSANPLAIPITIGAKEVITALVLSMGIVLTDNQSHYVMVNEIYNRRYEEVNQIVKEIEAGNRFSLLKEMEKFGETIKDVYRLTYDDTFTSKGYNYTKPTTIKKGATTNLKAGDSFTIPEGVTGKIFVYESGNYLTAMTLTGEATDFSLGLRKAGSTSSYIDVYGNGGVSAFKVYKQMSQCSLSVMFDVLEDFVSECSLTLNPDWDIFKEKNKDVTDSSLGASAGALANGSICADKTLGWSNDWDYTQEKDYPKDKDYAGDVGITVDDVLDKPSIDDTDTPETDNSLWNTLFGWLKTLFSPLTKLLGSIWDLIKGLFDMLKGVLTSILDLLKTLVQALVDAICALFVPTLAFEDVFKINQNTFFGQIVEFFNFNKLWDITPKPLAVDVEMPFYNFATQEKTPYKFEIKFFENKFMKENINLIRNVITYPLLISVAYFIILHFMPKRDID